MRFVVKYLLVGADRRHFRTAGEAIRIYVPVHSGDKYECMLDWDRMF